MENDNSLTKKFIVFSLFVILMQAKIPSADSAASVARSVEAVPDVISLFSLDSSRLSHENLFLRDNYYDLYATLFAPTVLTKDGSFDVFIHMTDQIREAHPEAETIVVARAHGQVAVLADSADAQNLITTSGRGEPITKGGFFPDLNKLNKFRVLDVPIEITPDINYQLHLGHVLEANDILNEVYTAAEVSSLQVFGPSGNGRAMLMEEFKQRTSRLPIDQLLAVELNYVQDRLMDYPAFIQLAHYRVRNVDDKEGHFRALAIQYLLANKPYITERQYNDFVRAFGLDGKLLNIKREDLRKSNNDDP